MRKILFFFSFLCASLCAVVTSHADEALLGNIKQTKDIAMLRLGLRHADARIRAASASRLGDLGDDASATIPALVGMFADPVSQVRASAAFSLSQMGAQALSALREALVHPNENYRIGASSALSEMGQGAQDAFDALAKATQDPQALVRGYAVRALGNLGPKSRLALPEISRALRDSSSIVRRYAGEAIQKIGAPAIPTLLKIIEASHDTALSKAPTVVSVKPSAVSSTKRRIRRARRKPSQATAGIVSTTSARTLPPKTPVAAVVPMPPSVPSAPPIIRSEPSTETPNTTASPTKTTPPIKRDIRPRKPRSLSPVVRTVARKVAKSSPKQRGQVLPKLTAWVEPTTSIAVDGDFAGWHTFGVQPLVYGAKQARENYPDQTTPTAAVLRFFLSLLRKDNAYQEVLAPTMKPALRDALKTQLPLLTKDLQKVFLHAYIERSDAIRAKKEVTKRIAEGGEQLFGSYNVLFFVEADNSKNDVFVFLRKMENRWYLQGIIAPFVRDILRKTLRQ